MFLTKNYQNNLRKIHSRTYNQFVYVVRSHGLGSTLTGWRVHSRGLETLLGVYVLRVSECISGTWIWDLYDNLILNSNPHTLY